MKKFLLFALCAISTVSAFAEPFSVQEYLTIRKNKGVNDACVYAYSAEVSSESVKYHLYAYLYQYRKLKGSLTVDEINNTAKKFQGIMNEKDYKMVLARSYAIDGHEKEMLQLQKQLKEANIYYAYVTTITKNKNKEKIWQYGKLTLLTDGGFLDANGAQTVLNTMFRYKPASITKEQQIEFLSKLAEIYPIPGTDFSKWKGFMGFVGFKYKQLTGKELF